GTTEIAGQTIPEGQMAILGPDRPHARLSAGARIMLAGGDPLDAPRFLDWNFVASSKERLAQAAADWRSSIASGFAGSRFTQPPAETSWVPLPGDPNPPDHNPDEPEHD